MSEPSIGPPRSTFWTCASKYAHDTARPSLSSRASPLLTTSSTRTHRVADRDPAAPRAEDLVAVVQLGRLARQLVHAADEDPRRQLRIERGAERRVARTGERA